MNVKEIAIYAVVAGVVIYIISRLYNKEEYFSVRGSYTSKYPQKEEKFPTYQPTEEKYPIIQQEERETIGLGITQEEVIPPFMTKPQVKKTSPIL